MNNILNIDADPISHPSKIWTRSMEQSRSNAINGIQSITEMCDYTRMYILGYIPTETEEQGEPQKIAAQLEELQEIKEEVKEKEEKEEVKEKEELVGGRKRLDNFKNIPQEMNQTTINQYKEKEIPKEEKIIKTTETTAQEDSKQFAEYRHLNIALNSIISEFNELIGLTDEALINIWPINPNNYRLYLKKGKDIFVFYNYIFNYYINNINNTLTAYLINDSFFVRDALFFYFINHFNNTSKKFLDITDEKKKNGILNEIFNLRVPKGGNEYLAIELQKKNINSNELSGQKGGENDNDDDDKEPKTLSEAIIKVVTGKYINKINLKYNDTGSTVELGVYIFFL